MSGQAFFFIAVSIFLIGYGAWSIRRIRKNPLLPKPEKEAAPEPVWPAYLIFLSFILFLLMVFLINYLTTGRCYN
jgi:hypothetical protein